MVRQAIWSAKYANELANNVDQNVKMETVEISEALKEVVSITNEKVKEVS